MILLFVKYLHFAHAEEKQEDISFADNYDAVCHFHATVAILSLISVLGPWQPCPEVHFHPPLQLRLDSKDERTTSWNSVHNWSIQIIKRTGAANAVFCLKDAF